MLLSLPIQFVSNQSKYNLAENGQILLCVIHILKKGNILKTGNSSTKSLAYTTLVGPILKYGAACWDPYREGKIHALGRVQKKSS